MSEVKSGEILVISKGIIYNSLTDAHIYGIIEEESNLSDNRDNYNMSTPVISGVKEACEKFKNGEIVTLDLDKGIIFKGIPSDSVK